VFGRSSDHRPELTEGVRGDCVSHLLFIVVSDKTRCCTDRQTDYFTDILNTGQLELIL